MTCREASCKPDVRASPKLRLSQAVLMPPWGLLRHHVSPMYELHLKSLKASGYLTSRGCCTACDLLPPKYGFLKCLAVFHVARVLSCLRPPPSKSMDFLRIIELQLLWFDFLWLALRFSLPCCTCNIHWNEFATVRLKRLSHSGIISKYSLSLYFACSSF